MGRKASASNKAANSEISTLSSLWVDVPPSSLEVKAIFPDYPSEDLIREIKDFCLKTGTPYLWRGHTHTKPPADGKQPEYVDRIEISADARKKKEFSPCPCCTPHHRKFGSGLIAWFEDECVIRLMGEDCFAKINAKAHEDAYRELLRRENERKILDRVLKIVDRLPKWISAADELLQIATQADKFFPVVENRIVKSQDVKNFWNEIRGGVLNVEEKVIRNTVGRDGYERGSDSIDRDNDQESFDFVKVSLFPVEGFSAMSPTRSSIADPLPEVISVLRGRMPTTRDQVMLLSPNDRYTLSVELMRCLETIKKARSSLAKQLPFLTQININRVNQWANDPRSPVYRHRFSIRRRDSKLIIGGRRSDYELDIPIELQSVLLPVLDFQDLLVRTGRL